MSSKYRKISVIVILCAIVSLAMGVAFIQQGFAKENLLVNAMKQEQITFSGVEGIVDNAEKAQLAGDTVREHRHSIAPTYGDLLGGGSFNPGDPTQLTYAQALNLENYLYLAVASFGLVTVVKVTGVFMIVMGVALGATGYALFNADER